MLCLRLADPFTSFQPITKNSLTQLILSLPPNYHVLIVFPSGYSPSALTLLLYRWHAFSTCLMQQVRFCFTPLLLDKSVQANSVVLRKSFWTHLTNYNDTSMLNLLSTYLESLSSLNWNYAHQNNQWCYARNESQECIVMILHNLSTAFDTRAHSQTFDSQLQHYCWCCKQVLLPPN